MHGARRDVPYFGLALALGMLVGILPLIGAGLEIDPFDKPSSYGIWLMGFFLSALCIGVLRPQKVWRWGVWVGCGFPVAVILDAAVKPGAYTLFPLTIMFSLIVGTLAGVAGAYVGKLIKRRNRTTVE